MMANTWMKTSKTTLIFSHFFCIFVLLLCAKQVNSNTHGIQSADDTCSPSCCTDCENKITILENEILLARNNTTECKPESVEIESFVGVTDGYQWLKLIVTGLLAFAMGSMGFVTNLFEKMTSASVKNKDFAMGSMGFVTNLSEKMMSASVKNNFAMGFVTNWVEKMTSKVSIKNKDDDQPTHRELSEDEIKTTVSIPLHGEHRDKKKGMSLMYYNNPNKIQVNEATDAAAEAGLQRLDEIITINDQNCADISKDQFEATFLRLKSDESVGSIDLEVIRQLHEDEEKATVSIPLHGEHRNKKQGLVLLYHSDPNKIRVNEATDAAAEAGLQRHDEIININDENCANNSQEQFEATFLRLKSDESVDSINLEVIRKSDRYSVDLEVISLPQK